MKPVERTALTLAAGGNGAARHAAALDAVGVGYAVDDDAWWATEPAPAIYHDWIGLRPATHAARVARRLAALFDARGGSVSVLDPWAGLDLASLGFAPDQPQHWYVREPGPATGPAARGLDLRLVTTPAELATFERTMTVGFGGVAPPEGTLLGAPLADDARFRFWLGRWHGEAVCTATAVVAGSVVGVYDVATLPHARGRGFATTATRAALAAAPDLPAVLDADAGVANLYARLGFRQFAVFRTWWRPAAEGRS